MSATSGGNSVRVSAGGGGSVSDGSEAGESSQSTMSVTDSPSTSFQANHESNITKINLGEESGSGIVHVDMTGSKVNLTLDETQSNEGMVNMGFDNEEDGANRGDDFKSINGSTKTDKVSEAVNLELVNMVPYSNGNGVSYGVPVNGIPVKKDSEGADVNSPYDEYFVPVNEHKKYMRGEKLYVTKDKRRPASWRRCLSWIVACAVISVVLIVAILAGTGVILSQDDSNVVKEASVGRNFAGANTKPSGTDGFLNKSSAGQWLSQANNRTHVYVPRAMELRLPLDNLEWNSAYMNSYSSEFQQISASTVDLLKMILFEEGKLDIDSADNLGLSMVNISQNPLELIYRMGWNFKQGSTTNDPITMDSVKKRLVDYLNSNQGFIDRYHIDVNGIHTGGVENICQVNNGGCSHICYYNYLNQQFTCTCPTNLILSSNMKTCVEWTESSEQDYASVPSRSSHPEVQFDSSELMEGGHDSHDHSHDHDVEHAHEMEPHIHSTFSNQANSDSTHHLNHDHHIQGTGLSDSSSEPIPNSGAELEPQPEPEPKPEPEPTASDKDDNSAHSYEHAYGVIQSGSTETNLNEDQAPNSNGSEKTDITESIAQNENEHQSNIEHITSPHYHHNHHEHGHDHDERNSNRESNEDYNFHGSVHTDTVDKVSPESKEESGYGSITESNLQPAVHNTEASSSPGIDSISDMVPVRSSMPTLTDQERENEEQKGNNSSDIIKTKIPLTSVLNENTEDQQQRKHQESSQNMGRSESDNDDSSDRHHVPLLEEILLEDSSPKSTEPHGEAHFNSSEQTLLLNGVLKLDGKPVTEEIVVDNSSPQTTESNPDLTTTPGNMNSNSNNNEHHLATAFESQSNVDDHTHSSSSAAVAEQSRTHDGKHDHHSEVYDSANHHVKEFNEGKNEHVTMKPGLNDDQTVVGTPFVIQEKVNESENANSSFVYSTENIKNESAILSHSTENTQKGISHNDTETFNPTLHPVTPTQIFETTVHEEKSPVNVNSELFVNEPEPKVKTRIENFSTTSPMNNKDEPSTEILGANSQSNVANNTYEMHTIETHSRSKQNGVTISAIEYSDMPKQEEGESTQPTVLNTEGNESQRGVFNDNEMMNKEVHKSEGNQPTSEAINFDKEAKPAMGEPQTLDTEKEGKTQLESTTRAINNDESKRSGQDEHIIPNVVTTTQATDFVGSETELNNTEKAEEKDLLMPHMIHPVTSSLDNGDSSTHYNQDDNSPENFKHQQNEPKTESPESADKISVGEKSKTNSGEAISQTEMTTETYNIQKTHGQEMGKGKEDEIIGTTEYFPASQTADSHQSTPLGLGITHSEDFSNNIKDDGIDNDEFNTLIDKEYKNEYSNDGKEHFNKYPNKQTFLKGDKKKVKDITKGDKTGSSKIEGEDVNKHYVNGEGSTHQKHVPDTGFDSEYSFQTEHTTTRLRKPTTIDAEGIPVLHFGTYDPHNPDFSFLHTVSPGFESETEVPNSEEGFIHKTESNDGLYDSKEDDLKTEKDPTKLDKDHKYDKQKGGKKKDLKKKGSTKDGKNVELDENRKYYTEITGLRTESPYTDSDKEQFKSSSDLPAITTFMSKVTGDDDNTNKKISPTLIHVENTDAEHPKQFGNENISSGSSSTPVYEITTHDAEVSVNKSSTVDPLVTGKSTDTINTTQFGENESDTPAATEFPNLGTKEMKEIKNMSVEKIKSESSLIRDDASIKEKESSTPFVNPVEKQSKNMHEHETPIKESHESVAGNEGGIQGFVTTTAPVSNGDVDLSAGRGHAPLSREMSSGNVTPVSSTTIINNTQSSIVNTQASFSNGTSDFGKFASTSQNSHSRPLVINSGAAHDGMTPRTFTSQENILDDGKTLREHQLLNEKMYFSHPTSASTHGVDNSKTNEDSLIYLNKDSSNTGHSGLIHNYGGHDVRTSSSTSYDLGDDKLIKRVFNITTIPKGHEGPYFVRNVTFATGNKSELNPSLFFKGHNDLLQNGQEFRYNTTHTFIAPPGNFSLRFGNHTPYKIDFDSKPETTFDESFTVQDGQYQTYTNSSGTFVYSKAQPSFVIKGNSGDFGRSFVYILGNNSRSNAFSSDSPNLMRSHHVIFKNSTVFAVRNATNNTVGSPVEGLESAKVLSNSTTKKPFQLTPSSLAADTLLKVGDYFGYISKCAAGQFQCLNGTSKRGYACINLSSKCDSINDCSDGSDEAGCIENNCPGNFQCSDGTCLKRHLVCNGIVECSDGSDEKQCENWKCEFDEIKCPSGRCIPVVWQCDGKADCDNHTDEQNCQRSCGNDEYLCPEGWCIPLTYKCNGVKECTNGEDEQLCDCSHDEFKCQSGGCVPKAQVCNGLDDCPDRSDEWNCMRLQSNSTLLQIRTPTGDFEPVCADNWSHDISDHVCASLGYSVSTSSDYGSFSVPFTAQKSFFKLKNGTFVKDQNSLVNLVRTNETCASQKWVEISCQEFSCGSRSMTDGSSVEGRLVGGMGATAGQWPSVALLYNVRNMQSCTANILTPRWVLASYNCLKMGNKNLNEKDWKLFGGSTVFEMEKESGETRKITAIIPHPQVKFNQFLFSNDLALVKLEEPLPFSSNLGAVCLPEQEIQPRQICVTAGWGMNGPEDKNIKQQLQYLPVPTMNLTECNSTEHYSGFVTDDKICAGYNTAEKSLCYNEEGAPLMCVNDRGEWELQGTLSYHSDCGRGSHPSIFSSIKPVKDWIRQTIGDSVNKKDSPD